MKRLLYVLMFLSANMLAMEDGRSKAPIGAVDPNERGAVTSPDGQWVVCLRSFGSLTFYNTRTAQLFQISGHGVEFSRDGQLLAIIDWDRLRSDDPSRVLVCNSNMEPVGPAIPGGDVKFSPNGQLVAVNGVDMGDDSGGVRLYKTSNMEPVGPAVPGGDVKFSPDGQFWAVFTYDWRNGSPRGWSGTGRMVTIYKTSNMERVGSAPERDDNIQFSPDGQLLAVTVACNGFDVVMIYKTSNLTLVGEVPGNYVSFSSDGQLFSITRLCYGFNTVGLYRASDRQQIGGNVSGHSAVFSPDGQLLAVTAQNDDRVDVVAIYKTLNMQPVGAPVPGHSSVFGLDGQSFSVTERNEGAEVVRSYNTQTLELMGTEVVPLPDLDQMAS